MEILIQNIQNGTFLQLLKTYVCMRYFLIKIKEMAVAEIIEMIPASYL